jgi:hypothetical protein
MAMGNTIPAISPPVTIGWHTAPLPQSPLTAAGAGMEGIEMTALATEGRQREVTRGERDADE